MEPNPQDIPTDVEISGSPIGDSKAHTNGPKRASLSKVLPSDRLSIERQIIALRAFAVVFESNGGKPVTNNEAGEVAKMAAATIVVTNAFFCDLGLLTRVDGGGGFTVSGEVMEFSRVETSGIAPESAPEKVRPLIERQWFMQILTPRLRMSPMDIPQIHKVLGEASNATREHLPRIDTLIDFIVYFGCGVREGNHIRYAGTVKKEESAIELIRPSPQALKKHVEGEDIDLSDGMQKYSIPLDHRTGRKFVIYAPKTVTTKELERIRGWLEFQLIVSDEP